MIREYIIKISDEIMEQEIADRPQELVRCKDCRWFTDGICEKYGFAHPQGWFCADGEQK